MLLTADQPVDNYWISLTQQYRIGAPMGFAVLHYNGSAANTLPHNGTSNPQPTTALPYSADQINEVRLCCKHMRTTTACHQGNRVWL